MQYFTLTNKLLTTHLRDLLSWETDYSQMASEMWNEDNFKRDLPHKWELSSIALEDGKPKGYVIASQKEEGDLRYGFVHRTFVVPSKRNGGPVLLRMLKVSQRTGRNLGLKQIRWYCSPRNARVYQWHKDGFADGVLNSKFEEGVEYDLFYKNLK